MWQRQSFAADLDADRRHSTRRRAEFCASLGGPTRGSPQRQRAWLARRQMRKNGRRKPDCAQPARGATMDEIWIAHLAALTVEGGKARSIADEAAFKGKITRIVNGSHGLTRHHGNNLLAKISEKADRDLQAVHRP